MGKIYYDEREGYSFVSDKNVEYNLLEGRSLKGQTTSDMIFIMLDTVHIFDDFCDCFEGDEAFVGYWMGTTDFSASNDWAEELDRLTDEYEEKYPKIIELFQKRTMIDKIRDTIQTLYYDYPELFIERKRDELKEQMVFLENF